MDTLILGLNATLDRKRMKKRKVKETMMRELKVVVF